MLKKLFLIVLFLTLNSALLCAVDFFLRPKAFMYIPSGEGNISPSGVLRYDIGGGADIGFEIDFSSIWPNPIGLGFSAGFEGGMVSKSLLSSNPSNLVLYSIGGSLGVSCFPLSRLFTRIDAAAGIYVPTLDGLNGPAGFYWRGGGEIGFRFTPSFLLSVNGGWRQYEDTRENRNPVSTGFYAGLTMQLSFGTSGSHNDGAQAVLTQSDAVYPALLQLYQTNPVGTLEIRNRENAEIRNVRVSFRASPYTSSELFCGTVSSIQRGSSAQLPLLADFSRDILRFTDSGRILGEVVIRYRFLGEERTAISVVSVACHNRNTITMESIEALAVFVSPTSPEVQDFSRFVVGLARSMRRIGHNQNMQFAVWLLEGLRASGIRLGETYALENEVQFPAETLAFRTGNARDLAMLYATSLESVGVSSAIIKIGTDYIVAINLSINPDMADTLFLSRERVININDEMWLPVAMSSFNEGFMECWTRAIVTVNQAFERDDNMDFVMMSDAWTFYAPAPLPALGTRLVRTDSANIVAGANSALNQYIAQDIVPLVWRTESLARTNPSAAVFNRLGILLARAGRIPEAKINYERAANMGSIPAMTNRGSLALNERDYTVAERWFRRALELDSRNATALRGLDRIEGRR